MNCISDLTFVVGCVCVRPVLAGCLMSLTPAQGAQELSSSMSSEDLHLMENEEMLSSCLAALRDIVGEAVPREELVRVALAADYDVNRAVNYFFFST